MNDRNKHKVTGQMNHQTADPKVNASVFLFFSTVHFFKTILAIRTNSTFGFLPTKKPTLKNQKSCFLPTLDKTKLEQTERRKRKYELKQTKLTIYHQLYLDSCG